MKLFKKATDINTSILAGKKSGNSIGFVPTMGALHQGHISLINASKKTDSVTVCSIFVNPAQFNDVRDFDKYPVTIEKDIDTLEKAGCDVLFLPSVSEIYPSGINNRPHFDLGYLESVLEGKYRPGHFQGVCMVVSRLLSIIPVNNLYLGQKDYQQCMVIKKLIELEQLNINISICPTLRETSGLALSSRNSRLSEKDRKQAAEIFETLAYVKNNIKPGDLTGLKQAAATNLTAAGFNVDYIEIADAGNLDILKNWDSKTPTVALAAAFIGDVRLIDNLLLTG
jgi:pantoate--beta-alanine ligase